MKRQNVKKIAGGNSTTRRLPPEAFKSLIVKPNHFIRHATFHDLKDCELIAEQYPANGGTLEIDFSDPDVFLYVYESDGKIRGYVQVGIFEEDFYCIDDIVVDKSFAGNGVGSALINFLFDHDKHIFLYVYTKNHRARKLYEKLGFIKTCMVQRFYAPDRHAFKMVKPNDNVGWIDFDTFEPIEKPASS